jgi:hypothetical protein
VPLQHVLHDERVHRLVRVEVIDGVVECGDAQPDAERDRGQQEAGAWPVRRGSLRAVPAQVDRRPLEAGAQNRLSLQRCRRACPELSTPFVVPAWVRVSDS